MEAIILAGGFGTRLQSVVADVPKPMAPINDKPFLAYLVEELISNGITRIIMAVGYKKEVIEDYFKNNYKGCTIEYSNEDTPLGTGGCVKQAFSLCNEDKVFVINGDTMFKVDLNKMALLGANSIAVKPLTNFDRYGEVVFNEYINLFKEKQNCSKGHINGGIYLLNKNIFDNYNLENRFSLEVDFFEKYLKELKLKPFISDTYFIDIGIPEDYEKAGVDFE